MIGTLLPEVQDHRTAVLILSLEADRLVRDGRPGAALQLVPAMLNVARGLDGEPFLISALVRFACDAVTARRAERTLALGVPTGGLAEVQAALLAEAEGDVFWGPFRGERACLDHLFTNLRTGVVPPNLVLSLADSSGSPPAGLESGGDGLVVPAVRRPRPRRYAGAAHRHVRGRPAARAPAAGGPQGGPAPAGRPRHPTHPAVAPARREGA